MKILIAYASKTGTTHECAELLAGMLSGRDVTLCDLSSMSPDLSVYDVAIVGGPVRFGKLMKPVSRFVAINRERLAAMKSGYFVCCGYTENTEEYLEKLFPAELKKKAFAVASFGGDFKPKRQKNVFMKLIVSAMRNSIEENSATDNPAQTHTLPEILPNEISKFADALKRVSDSTAN